MTRPFDLWGQTGWANFDVVGESNYLTNIRTIITRAGTILSGNARTKASLIPEPWNQYDHNAVRVDCDGLTVGYLSRQDAVRYQPVLSRVVAAGHIPQVGAFVSLNEDEDIDLDDDRPPQQVIGYAKIDLAEPGLIFPANQPPRSSYAVLPDTRRCVQVSGENLHMDTLAPLLADNDVVSLWVTLREHVEQRPRSTKTLVGVAVDDAPVGTLSAQTSADLLPVVAHLAASGLCAVAKAELRGNRLKADVRVYAPAATEVSNTWLDDPLGEATRPAAPTVANQPGQASASRRFNAPPGWPPPPPEWVPPNGWRPDQSWPPAPAAWQFWVPA